MGLVRWAVSAAACCLLTGCHSAFVEATVVNASGEPVSPVEMDYPSASFGTASLSSGATFKYRFKVQGSGPTRLLWTDAHHQDHSAAGPSLSERDEGRLTVTLTAGTPTWKLDLLHQAGAR